MKQINLSKIVVLISFFTFSFSCNDGKVGIKGSGNTDNEIYIADNIQVENRGARSIEELKTHISWGTAEGIKKNNKKAIDFLETHEGKIVYLDITFDGTSQDFFVEEYDDYGFYRDDFITFDVYQNIDEEDQVTAIEFFIPTLYHSTKKRAEYPDKLEDWHFWDQATIFYVYIGKIEKADKFLEYTPADIYVLKGYFKIKNVGGGDAGWYPCELEAVPAESVY